MHSGTNTRLVKTLNQPVDLKTQLDDSTYMPLLQVFWLHQATFLSLVNSPHISFHGVTLIYSEHQSVMYDSTVFKYDCLDQLPESLSKHIVGELWDLSHQQATLLNTEQV